ncbi:MAG: hypothetical protein OT477_05495 [Chloroflexi bacterium]|nr:hypothetical protein [Chloroflexota bacterium]
MKWFSILAWALGLVLGVACQQEKPPTAVPIPTAEPVPHIVPEPTPEEISWPAFGEVVAQDLLFDEGFAYVAAGEMGLVVYEMEGGTGEATAVAHLPLPTYQLFFDGHLLYALGCERQCIRAVDISNPTDLAVVDEIIYTSQVSPVVAMTKYYKHLYLGLANGEVMAVNVSVRPWFMASRYPLGQEIISLAGGNDYLYAAVPQGLYMLDIADPTQIREQEYELALKPVWHEETAGIMGDMLMVGDDLYITSGTRGLRYYQPNTETSRTHQSLRNTGVFQYVRGEALQVGWQEPYLYVTSWAEQEDTHYLTVISTPVVSRTWTFPQVVQEYALTAEAPQKFVVQEGVVYLLVNGRITTLTLDPIVDIATETTPELPPTEQLDLVTRLGGRFSLDVQGHYAYVSSQNEFQVWDISIPETPIQLSSSIIPARIESTYVKGAYAYLMIIYETGRKMLVLDISDPTQPSQLAQSQQPISQIALGEDVVYALGADWLPSWQLWSLETGNLPNIELLNQYRPDFTEIIKDDLSGYFLPTALQIKDNLIFMTWYGDEYDSDELLGSGVLVLDVSNPIPVVIGSFYAPEMHLINLAIEGNRLVAVDKATSQLLLFDISQPASPQLVSSYPIESNEMAWPQVLQLDIVSGVVYINDEEHNLNRFRIDEQGNFAKTTPYYTDTYVQGFQVRPPFVYLVSQGRGLEIAQMGESDNLVPMTLYRPAINADDIVLNGEWAYVADNGRGLHILNLAHPLAPEVRGTVNGSNYPQTLQLADDGYLYATTISETVDVFDVSRPFIPQYLTTLPFTATHLLVQNGRAYVTLPHELQIWDMSGGNRPQQLGHYPLIERSYFPVAVQEPYIYLSIGYQALVVLDMSDLSHVVPVYSVDEFPNVPSPLFDASQPEIIDNKLYTICDLAGICVYDLSSPKAPQFLYVVAQGYTQDFVVEGETLYFVQADYYSGAYAAVYGFDLGDQRPLYTGEGTVYDHFHAVWGGSYQLATADGIIYMAAGNAGLIVLQRVPIPAE